jgi:hypothetical protein
MMFKPVTWARTCELPPENSTYMHPHSFLVFLSLNLSPLCTCD